MPRGLAAAEPGAWPIVRMFRRLNKFIALPARHKRLLVEAGLALGRARFLLTRRPFKRLVPGPESRDGPGAATGPDAGTLATLQEISLALRRAARYTPWQSACLVQALAARHMMQKRGIPGALSMAAALDGAGQPDKMSAHAWVKCGSHFVTGEEGHERYTVLSTFGWPGRPAAPGD